MRENMREKRDSENYIAFVRKGKPLDERCPIACSSMESSIETSET
jgi:hypothetical protein